GFLDLILNYEKEIEKIIDWVHESLVRGSNIERIGIQLWFNLRNEDPSSFNGKGIAWIKRAAEQDSAQAQYYLACCYRDGVAAEQNDALAFEWFYKAAAQGYAGALYPLARCFYFGCGVQQDSELAFKWITESVQHIDQFLLEDKNKKGDVNKAAEAYLLLADMYARGNGVAQSDEQACHWFEKAAEQGVYEIADHDPRHAIFRAAIYALSRKNYEKGMRWIMELVEQGYAGAYNWLVDSYLALVIPEALDKAQTERCYRLVYAWCTETAKGYDTITANILLGVLHAAGKGVEQNDVLAFEYFNKASNSWEELDVVGDGAFDFIMLFLSNCYSQGKGVEKDLKKARNLRGEIGASLSDFAKILVQGITSRPYEYVHHNRSLGLLRLNLLIQTRQYKSAEEFVEKFFENAAETESSYKDICLTTIEQAEELDQKNKELEAKNKALEAEIKQKEQAHQALREKEKEMLSFFTHTMRNALATGPESLRQAIYLLGSDIYDKDTNHYKAINKIASLFSSLSLTDCLIDMFKQSISDPQAFKQAWNNDQSGDASPKWVLASALRQSLNRIIFMSDASDLKKLLNRPETALIKATRKSFIDEVLPLDMDEQAVDRFYEWVDHHIACLEIVLSKIETIKFGTNQTRFSLLFAITSELILNAFRYWDGTNNIQISWRLVDGCCVFRVKNHCQPNATSRMAGTHKGLAFIKRLTELLGEQARFNCSVEHQSFIADLTLDKSLFSSGL
ncbi:hypothetical protein L0152_14350, partial [bacterium]|nr:hypothetical protein [bacterium]